MSVHVSGPPGAEVEGRSGTNPTAGVSIPQACVTRATAGKERDPGSYSWRTLTQLVPSEKLRVSKAPPTETLQGGHHAFPGLPDPRFPNASDSAAPALRFSGD